LNAGHHLVAGGRQQVVDLERAASVEPGLAGPLLHRGQRNPEYRAVDAAEDNHLALLLTDVVLTAHPDERADDHQHREHHEKHAEDDRAATAS